MGISARRVAVRAIPEGRNGSILDGEIHHLALARAVRGVHARQSARQALGRYIMAAGNLALIFGAGVAGAVIIDYGVRSTKSAFASAPSGGSVTGKAAPFGKVKFPVQGTGVRWERTDQGVDASAPAGLPVRALESGTVTGIINFYLGQPAIIVSSPGLPGGATGIYYSEGITPNVKVGQRVTAGQQIGTTTGGSGMEFGFWKGASTLAQATTGYIEGEITAAGRLFHQWLGIPNAIY